MPEYNIPDKRNYFVSSRVTVWISRKFEDGSYSLLLPVGNVIGSGFTPEIERLEHNTNLRGIDSQDSNPVIKKGGSFSVEIDELVKENLEYLLGSNPRLASQTFLLPLWEKKTLVAGTTTINSGQPISSVISIRKESGEGEYEEGATADYEVNEATGVITLSGGSGIGLNDVVIIYYLVSKVGTKYGILENTDVVGRARIVSAGGEIGPKKYIEFPEVEISVDGELNLLPKTEWQTATLRFDLVEDASLGFGAWYNF